MDRENLDERQTQGTMGETNAISVRRESFENMNTLLSAIFKFCTTNQLFEYFRRRYSNQQLNILNKLITTHGKIRSAISQTSFLKAFIGQRKLPKFVRFRIEKSSARRIPNIEGAFLHYEIEKSKSLTTFLKGNLRALWQEVRQFLSSFNFIRFCRYIASIVEWERTRTCNQERTKIQISFSTAIWQHGETKQEDYYQSF